MYNNLQMVNTFKESKYFKNKISYEESFPNPILQDVMNGPNTI